MNLSETAGGSSRKGQENGDASNETDRPLKKARFAWQVKGKYHLKNDSADTAKTSTARSPDPDVGESSSSGNSNNSRGPEQNLEILGDYLIKQDFKAIVGPEPSPFQPSTSMTNEPMLYPRYVSSYEQNLTNNTHGLRESIDLNTPMMRTLPLSMIISRNFAEDQCIARWQQKQMVKSFVDNTINRVLDLWIQETLPPPNNERSRSIALDVADFINNLPGDNSVENEGILMAISAHGLQKPPCSDSSSDTEDNDQNSVSNDGDNFHPLTQLPSDDESHEPMNRNVQCDTSSNDTSNDMAWSYDDQKIESDDATSSPLFPDTSDLSSQDVNDSHQNSSTVSDGIHNPVENHCDFLDEAILFAIQSKGLTTFGSDYG